jgi:hypothetical protein
MNTAKVECNEEEEVMAAVAQMDEALMRIGAALEEADAPPPQMENLWRWAKSSAGLVHWVDGGWPDRLATIELRMPEAARIAYIMHFMAKSAEPYEPLVEATRRFWDSVDYTLGKLGNGDCVYNYVDAFIQPNPRRPPGRPLIQSIEETENDHYSRYCHRHHLPRARGFRCRR